MSVMPDGSKLRIGLLMDSLDLWAWEWTMLKRIAESDYAELSLIVVNADAPSRRAHDVEPQARRSNTLSSLVAWVLRLTYRILEAKIDCEPDAFSLRDGTSLLSSIPTVMLAAASEEGADYFVAEDIDRLRQFGLDVLIRLGLGPVGDEVGAAAKYGIWFLNHAHDRCEDRAPPGFWEVYFGWPVNVMLLQVLGNRESTVLACSLSATNRLSVKLNRSSVYWKALSLIPRRLEELHQVGERTLLNVVDRPTNRAALNGGRRLGSPTNVQMALHIGRNVTQRARELLSRKFTLQQWILLCHPGEGLSTAISQFRKIVPPKDRYWADPHVIKRGAKYYVFVEEYIFCSEKGHISVLELDEKGQHLSTTKVLEREYHLSYPCIFEHDGNLFMVPESSANRTIELYRCIEFPHKWVFVRNLLDGLFAVDSTLLHHNGRWWLFANVVENTGASPSDELFLFHSSSLCNGRWTAHRLNPIISDVTRSRPAGPILRKAGKLYRPAQDCSVRYGYAITINEITTLSEESYDERQVDRIKPNWDKRIVATHTLSYAPGLTVMDCLQPRLRLC